MSHLDDDALTQHAVGQLDDTTRAVVLGHLETCAICQTRLEEVTAFVNSKTYAAPISSHPPAGRQTRPDGPGAGVDDAPVLQKNSTLGRYVLLERLGAGGMGEVFAAYDPQLDRKVALKLLRSGTLSATEGRARLLREAQAMARLQHPNVVTVHDVGIVDDRVFIAMEFIDGETLGQWSRGNRTWQDTLRMFLMAGSGLAAAHRAGIVHRDFKPDNILIGADGRPRVLDFGLARQTSSTDAQKPVEPAPDTPLGSPLTRDGAVMGTPGYMAPEQLGGLPTDARSDQFSFCVAMYEALYGKRPFGGATLKAHATEIVINRLPPPPSGHEAPAYLWEAMKRGLTADPAGRWPNMEALLSALRPRRSGVRRGRMLGAVVALGVIAAGGVGFSVWSTQRLRICGGAEKQLVGVWDAAAKLRLRGAFSDTGASFALDAFKGVESALDAYTQSWVSAEKDSCEAVRIRKTDSEELYERKSICLDTRLKQLRALVNLLETADKDVVSNAVAAARGLDRIDDCRDAVALALHGAPSSAAEREKEDTLRSRIIEAKALLDAGKYARGVEVARSAVIAGGSPAGLAEAWLLLGRLQMRAGDTKGAEESYFEAATHAETAGDAALAARAFSRLYATIGAVQNRFEAAHPWERLAVAASARLGNDPDVEAELASNSGDVALAESRPADAKKQFERALRIRESTLPEGHPELAMTLNNLGAAEFALKLYDEAARSSERALELHVRYEGTEHPNTASSMNNLAIIYKKQGRHSEALTLFERALQIRIATQPDSPETAASHIALAKLLERMELPEKALDHLQAALKIRKKALGDDHLQVAAVHGDIADLFLEKHAWQEAQREAQAALDIDEKSLGPGHLTTAAARERLGLTFIGLGQWEKANAALTAAMDVRREKSGLESVDVARSLGSFGALQLAQGHADKALPYYEKALGMRERLGGTTSTSLASDLVGIGRCQGALKSWDKAVAPLERAVALREKGDDASELGVARFELARALWETSTDSHDRARSLADQAKDALNGVAKDDVEKWLAAH